MAAQMSPRDGSLSARGMNTSRKLKATLQGPRNNDFLTLVERNVDAFVANDDSAVEDIRHILTDVRQKYNQVHTEVEKNEAELTRLREAIRVADVLHSSRADEAGKKDNTRQKLEEELDKTKQAIHEAETSRKVYEHMLARISREQAILKQKMLAMESHLRRKSQEANRKVTQNRKLHSEKVQLEKEQELMEQDVDMERNACKQAEEGMKGAVEMRKDSTKRRQAFDRWRHDIAKKAANEAFNASAGRLRKLYAVEKLAGNGLQQITLANIDRSQATEEGFQRIREVTGLTDVMDIVHKFLNRETEQEQLKSSVKEAEVRLDALKEEYENYKRDTDGITFDPVATDRSRAIYQEVESHEEKLNQTLKDHELSRLRLQKSTLQVEHMKRWANRVGRLLSSFEDARRVDKPADLAEFFQQMHRAVDKFVAHITQQISTGKVQRKNMSQAASKEYHEASRLLVDKDFLKANCRVPASADGRPASRQGAGAVGQEEDSQETVQADRKKIKEERAAGERKAEMRAKIKAGAKAA